MLNVDLYEFFRGPAMTGTLLLFCAGLVIRIVQFYRSTTRIPREPASGSRLPGRRPGLIRRWLRLPEKIFYVKTHYRNSAIGMMPFALWLTAFYHVLILVAILFAQGHNVLLEMSWGFSFPSLPDKTMDLLTIFVMVVSVFYLVRRAVYAKMKFPNRYRDFAAILATLLPFVTGFMAYHQWFDYRTVIICHMISAQLMLLALLYTKLGHLIFFFFGRISLHGELNVWGGRRIWKNDQEQAKLPAAVGKDSVDTPYIRYLLDQKKSQMNMMLLYCARCSNCASSCFLYANSGDASFIPSHKLFASLGKLYRKKGEVSRKELEAMVDPIWNKCVLCERCYCPIGLKIPEMISMARTICRSQGVYKTYDH